MYSYDCKRCPVLCNSNTLFFLYIVQNTIVLVQPAFLFVCLFVFFFRGGGGTLVPKSKHPIRWSLFFPRWVKSEYTHSNPSIVISYSWFWIMEFENRLLYKFLVKGASAIDLLRSVFVVFRSSWHPFPQIHLSSLWDNWQSYSHSLCTDKKLTLVSRQKNDVQIPKQDLIIIHL